jgi:hypothetical protein
MAQKFNAAFFDPNDEDGEFRPPLKDTLLLEGTPRFCLVPFKPINGQPQADTLEQLTFTPNDVIELRLSRLGPIVDAVDPAIDINMDADDKTTYHTISPTTTLPNATYHCTNLFDLLAILRRLTPSQRSSIHAFKIR